jgi:hypothetical protein
MVVGLAVMATMLVLAATLLAVRGIVVGAAAPQSAAAAAATFDIVVRFVRAALRTLFVVGLVVALAAWVTGPAATAVRLRGALGRGIGSLRRGGLARRLATGPVGPWVHEHRVALRTGLVVLAALVVVLWDRPSGWTVLVVTLLLLVLLGVVELLDQPRSTDATPTAATAGTTVGSGDGASSGVEGGPS